MRRRLCLSMLAMAAVTAALLPAATSAERYEVATGVGYRCVANTVVPNRTLLVAGENATDWPRVVPGGADSVIGGWGVELAPGLGPIAQQLVVFEPLGNGAYRKVAESKLETVRPGNNGFSVRIPVKGGEAVGLFGPDGTLACNGEAETFERTEPVSLRSEGSAAIGGTLTFETESGLGTPVGTAVEPDNDGDGYGDYGDDRCDETASRGSDCPIPVRIGRTVVKERAILIPVTPAKWARIDVGGQVLWKKNGLLVGADLDGGKKRVPGGRTAVFRIPLPKPVLRQLERRRPGQSMIARIGAFIVDRDGWESDKSRRVVMWGRG
jgi:hypothetical protein